jgi:hypothetical protein
MAVKKIIADYQSYEFRDLVWLQTKLDELNSYTEDYYIAQRDAYNQKLEEEYDKIQKEKWDQWNSMKQDLMSYSTKYYEIMRSHAFNLREADRLIFDQYCTYKISRFIEYEVISGEKPCPKNWAIGPKEYQDA